MPRTCTICSNPNRPEIDGALISPDSLRAIAGRYGTSKSALERHRDNCISAQLSKAKELQDSATGSDLISRLREIHAETGAILARAKKSKDWATALRAITRLERQIELEAELLGELDRGGRGGDTRIEVVYIDKAVITSGAAPAAPRVIETPAAPAAEGESRRNGIAPDG
jgi:hypothetical protein